MIIHHLKTWPKYFAAIENGEKTFEVRAERDRHFEPGDYLYLHEFDQDKKLTPENTFSK